MTILGCGYARLEFMYTVSLRNTKFYYEENQLMNVGIFTKNIKDNLVLQEMSFGWITR